jgi:23S rRNA pseudouridine2605 synthase
MAKTEQAESKPGERIAKVIARSGLCSRRDAERLIEAGRVRLNGRVLKSPAVNVTEADDVRVDRKPLPKLEAPQLWRYHKPAGLITSHKDPEGRPSVFDNLPADLPRVISVGRLDMSSEGLLLLTNDGELARTLELPATGWLRRYRVRAYGAVSQEKLDRLKQGVEIDGVKYGAIDAAVERVQKDNMWLTMALREGKNREVRRVLEYFDLKVNRLIRISYGPFQLGELKRGTVAKVPDRVLREQMGGLLVGKTPAKIHKQKRGADRRRKA